MSAHSSSSALPLKRDRQHEAENSSHNKRIHLDHNRNKSPKSEPGLEPKKPLVPHEGAARPSLPPNDESTSAKNKARLISLDTSHFVHEPLLLYRPSIRLIKILPPAEDGTIRCSIRHASLNQLTEDGTGIEYTCLSYVWGPETTTCTILINDKPFKVRENLWDFLHANSTPAAQRLMDDNGKTHDLEVKSWFESIWIDALCIDQQSVLERNHQVQQMGKIYSGATRVISWMGDDAKIAKFLSMAQRYMKSRFECFSGDPMPYHGRFCKSIYWQRAWITQELLLAHVLFIQAKEIIVPLPRLEKVTKDLETIYGEFLDPEIRGLLRYLVSERITYQSSHRLIENMELFREKKCSDIRDRVYSLLAVSSNGIDLIVDYGRPFPQLARHLLRTIKDDCCLQRLALVCETLQLDRNLSESAKARPLLSIDYHAGSQPDMACSRCGRIFRSRYPKDPDRWEAVWYFCLCCQHSDRGKVMQTHKTSHFGYLMAYTPKRNSTKSCHLHWGSAKDPSIWPEIEVPKGLFVKLSALRISIQIFMTIMRFAAVFDDSKPLGFSIDDHSAADNHAPSPWKFDSAWMDLGDTA